ncbi:MAG: Uma2 family endonuclease [Acidobacteriota bacterium]
MSAVHSVLPQTPVYETGQRKRFTRAEMDQLLSTGAFEGQRFELIDGDLIEKLGQNPPHSQAIRLVSKLLASFVESDRIQVQLPIDLAIPDGNRNVPEPDIAVLTELKREFDHRHPRAEELVLIVEVADTSAALDLSRKAELYAQAGVPEYWVLDLNRRMLVIHRQTDGTQYRNTQLHSENDRVTMKGRSESVQVSALLPTA